LVTQQNIGATICRAGYTATIRPPVSYTNALKRTQLRSLPYSSYGSTDSTLFEEDHLIPLEVGGSPSSVKNLWPEPWTGNYGAHYKDQLENKLHSLVCSRALPLAVAQSAISANWIDAYEQYVLGLTPTNSAASPPLAPPQTPSPSPSTLESHTPLSLPTPSPTLSAPTAVASLPPIPVIAPTQIPAPSVPSPAPSPPLPPPQPIPASTSTQPAGATGKCNDGTYSYAAHHQGMCSGHGGVAQFYI
jgi:hypothetical protein